MDAAVRRSISRFIPTTVVIAACRICSQLSNKRLHLDDETQAAFIVFPSQHVDEIMDCSQDVHQLSR